VVKSRHLKCKALKIRPKFYETRLIKHSDKVSFLFKVQRMKIHEAMHPYIGDGDLGSKSQRGMVVICEKPSKR